MRVSESLPAGSLVVLLALMAIARPASAQISVRPCDGPDLVAPRPVFSLASPASIDVPLFRPDAVRAASAAPARPAMLSAYGALVGLQVLDIQSTLRGVRLGARESNPALRGVATHPAALAATKAASTAVAIAFTERLRKRHPWRAYALITALDGAYVAIVSHNYRAVR